MSISANNIVQSINSLSFELLKAGIIVESREHSIVTLSGSKTRISWGQDGYILVHNGFASLQEYIDLVDNRQYSMLFEDGSFAQISYELKRSNLTKHRLCWYPCPLHLERDEWQERGLTDVILDKIHDADLDVFRSRTPLRFDYDPDAQLPGHPSVHLHLNEEECRIPVKSPISLRRFFDFINTHFLESIISPEILKQNAFSWQLGDKLTADERADLHFSYIENIDPT